MPVINTRKRKPDELSPLEQLATVSAHELNTSSYAPSSTSSYGSDEDNNGNLNERVSSFKRRRSRVDLNSDVDEEELEDQMTQMRLMLRRAERALARKRDTSYRRQSYADHGCSPSIHEEILRLQVQVDNILHRGTSHPSQSVAVTPLQKLQSVRDSIHTIQIALDGPPRRELAQQITPLLEKLWQDARMRSEDDLRAKLSLWKHQALDLKERLRVSLASAAAEGRPPSPPKPLQTTNSPAPATPMPTVLPSVPTPHQEPGNSNPTVIRSHPSGRDSVLQHALEFVSSFYLFDSLPASFPAGNDALKQTVLTKTADDIIDSVRYARARQLHSVQQHRAREPTTMSAFAVQSNPTASPTRADPSSASLQVSPPATSLSTTSNFFADDDQGDDDPSEEDEPLPMQSPQSVASSTVPVNVQDSSKSGTTAHPALASVKLANSAGVISLNARRRLKDLIDSQLHKQSKQSVPPPDQQHSSAPNLAPQSAPANTIATPISSEPSNTVSATGGSDFNTVGQAAGLDERPASPFPELVRVAPKHKLPRSKPQLSAIPIVSAAGAMAPTSQPSSVRTTASTSNSSERSEKTAPTGNGCAACGMNDSYASLLLCDNDCGREYHTFCLEPPIVKIPEDDWYCPKCKQVENIQPGQRIYLCSAPACDKITGAKYCSQHRCEYPNCVNRKQTYGPYCRRHDALRMSKLYTAQDSSIVAPLRPVASNAGRGGKSATTKAVSTSASPPRPPPPPPRKLTTKKDHLQTERLATTMREMGIWLPNDLLGTPTSTGQTRKGDPPAKLTTAKRLSHQPKASKRA